MAIDTNIPLGAPGIAGFASETFGGPAELMYGDTPLRSTTHHVITAQAALTLPLGAVISELGPLATVSGGAAATGTVTFATAQPSNGETVTIAGRVYTFRNALTVPAVPNEVLAGASISAAAANLTAAINGAAGAGTTYSTGTLANEQVSASAAAGVVTLTARQFGTVGNAITLAETGANIAVSAAALTSGANPTSNAFGILATAVAMAAGDSMSVPIYRSGHFNMLALTFDSSFDLDAEKQRAFQYAGSPSPTILISKPKHLDTHVNI